MGGVTYWENDQDTTVPDVNKYAGQFWVGNSVVIGKGCKIQPHAFIPDGVTIEDDVFIGPNVTFCNDKYPPSGGKEWRSTLVKARASIGAGAVILPGVVIGNDAVIGAGAVVTRSVPDEEIWVGNPAKRIRTQIKQGIRITR
jgi:acetyltransferase-like isoleucine patch superfamily enzyme